MPCLPFHSADGQFSGIVCTRGRRGKRRPCATCKAPADLECDGAGCDKPLCHACAVSPRNGLDFCPSCCREVFVQWLNHEDGKAAYLVGPTEAARKSNGRNAFRAWAKARAEKFIEFVRGRALTPGEIIWAPKSAGAP